MTASKNMNPLLYSCLIIFSIISDAWPKLLQAKDLPAHGSKELERRIFLRKYD